MIVLLTASAITLTALQASINAPREAFRVCLKEANTKAVSEKVAPDAFDAYVRSACSGQLSSFKTAAMNFDMKNKMSKKAAGDDADAMVGDFLSSALERYEYDFSKLNGPPKQEAAAAKPTAATPQPTPAAVPK